MSTFVLVPGAWHGAWCWEKVTPLLERLGHTVYALDLPGQGSDTTPISEITLKSNTNKVLTAIERADEPVILVGHSLGGLVISQTAEYVSEKIKSLVYLTAFLLKDGETMAEYIEADKESVVTSSLDFSEDGSAATVKEEKLVEAFYAQCDPNDVEKIKPLLVPQSSKVFSAELSVSDEAFGKVPRYYIECLKDQAITHQNQKKMYTSTPCEKVFTIDTDHSPFYSAPKELAAALHEISQE